MSEHTKGPWEVDVTNTPDSYGRKQYVIFTGVEEIATFWDKTDVNFQRIVRCVNALEGVDDPEGLVNFVKHLATNGCTRYALNVGCGSSDNKCDSCEALALFPTEKKNNENPL